MHTTTDRLAGRFVRFAVVAAAVGVGVGTPCLGVNLLADYQFHGNLNSTGVAAPALTGLNNVFYSGSEVDGQAVDTLSFRRGSGLRMDVPANLGVNGYTVELLFTFDENTGYRKIVDFKDRASDTGFYALSGQLNFYPVVTAPQTTIQTSVFSQVVITRDSAGTFTAYTDGVQQFTFTDTALYGVPATTALNLFIDDFATGQGEASAGRAARVRLYNGAMTGAQVAALDRSVLGGCGFADFNGDGDAGTDLDIEAFFACLAGVCCPTCGSADFNADGDIGTDSDIEAFFRVLAGAHC